MHTAESEIGMLWIIMLNTFDRSRQFDFEMDATGLKVQGSSIFDRKFLQIQSTSADTNREHGALTFLFVFNFLQILQLDLAGSNVSASQTATQAPLAEHRISSTRMSSFRNCEFDG